MYCSLKLKRYEKNAENIGTYRDHRFDSPGGDMLREAVQAGCFLRDDLLI